jgi:DNA-directed RNA polymerase specialized sigma24 family protein
MTFTFTNADHAAVASATKILKSRYREYVDYEDIQQELYVWLLGHYDRAEAWREKYETRHAERTLCKALRNAGERYCRAEKAEKEGYSTDDEFFYSIPMVADLLQLYFDPDWSQPNGIELTTTSSGKPASEGGNLMAMVSDVGRAFQGLPEPDRTLLGGVYGYGNRPNDEIAGLSCEWDISYSAAASRVRRVVGRLRAALGGASPYGEERE